MFVTQKRYELLRRYLPTRENLFKQADIDEKSYEQALSNIAHAYLQDKVPELLPHELGFQLVEKSEDDNKAVGIFGFKIGTILIYIPIFFVDGKIKGLDLMYIYNLHRFVPATSKYIDRIKRLQHGALGEPTVFEPPRQVGTFPNLMQLKPQTMKWASSQPKWLRPFLDVLLEAKHNPGNIKFPVYDFSGLITKSASASRFLIDTLSSYPTLVVDLHKAYGKSLQELVKLAGQIVQRYPEEFKTNREDFEPKTQPPADLDRSGQPYQVEIYFFIDEEAPQHLSEEEVRRLIRQGYLIRDNRKQHSRAVIIEEPEVEEKVYGGVPRTGWRNLVLLSGETCPGYVVPILNQIATAQKAPNTFEQKRGDRRIPRRYLVVPCPEGKERPQGVILSQAQITVASEDPDPDERPRLPTVSSFQFENVRRDVGRRIPSYVIFTEEAATVPITIVGDTYDNELGVRTLIGTADHTFDDCCCDESDFDRNPWPEIRVLVKPSAKKIHVVKEFVPGEHRYKRVTYIVPPDAWVVEIDTMQEKVPHLMPSAMVAPILSKIADDRITLARINESEYAINRQAYSIRDTIRKLVLDYGLSEADTLRLLKAAAFNSINVLIKRAADEIPLPPNVPIPPSMPLPDIMMMNVGQLAGREMRAPAFGYSQIKSDISRDYPNLLDPLATDATVDQMLRAAIQSGQKEVLDTSVFASLLKAVDDRDLIERYLPDLLSGLDALGRVLFNFYMHNEVFKDRYGENELESMEQNLRNTFRSLGDIVLRLEQRPMIGIQSYKQIIGLKE